jgi:hypothetical protein
VVTVPGDLLRLFLTQVMAHSIAAAPCCSNKTDAVSVVVVVFYRVSMEESVQKPLIPRVVEDAFGGQFWLFSSNQDDGSERQYVLLYTSVSNVPSKMNGFVFRSFAGQWRILSGRKRATTTAEDRS